MSNYADMVNALESFKKARAHQLYPKADCVIADDVLRSLKDAGEKPFVSNRDIEQIFKLHFQCDTVSIESLASSGTFHYLYKVKLMDQSCWAFRVNKLSSIYQDVALQLEHQVTEKVVETLGDIAPVVIVTDISRTQFNFDYQISEWIEEKTLKAYDDNEPLMLSLLEKFSTILAKIHNIPMNSYGLLTLEMKGAHPVWKNFVLCQLNEHLHYLITNNLINRMEYDKCFNIFKKSESIFYNGPAYLLHGDPSSHNVFTDGKTIKKIIDWEDCIAGDPLYEVAFLATFHPQRRWNIIVNSYVSAVQEFEDFNNRFWIYFLRIAILKTVIRHRFGYADVLGQAAASQRIKLALDAIDSNAMVKEIS